MNSANFRFLVKLGTPISCASQRCCDRVLGQICQRIKRKRRRLSHEAFDRQSVLPLIDLGVGRVRANIEMLDRRDPRLHQFIKRWFAVSWIRGAENQFFSQRVGRLRKQIPAVASDLRDGDTRCSEENIAA